MLPQHLYCTLAPLLSVCKANQQTLQERCMCVCRGTFFCSGDQMWEPLGLDTSSYSLSFFSARWDGAPSRSLLGQVWHTSSNVLKIRPPLYRLHHSVFL